MNLICTLKHSPVFIICLLGLLFAQETAAQVCATPATTAYGLDDNGFIYPVNMTNAVVSPRINPAYTGNSVSSPNAMGYNASNGRFYYFKRNADQSSQEFVSFNPATNTYTILASCPSTANIKTGCVNFNGSGYYCIDDNATLYFFRFTSGMWRQIANNYVNQFGTNVTAILSAHSSGDIAMDGFGNIWFLCSSTTTYGLYRFDAPIPTTTVGTMTARQKIAATTPTPTGNSFAGIAFNPTGQIYISQHGDDRFYRLNNNLSLTLVGTFSTGGVGTDLTSCVYPMVALASDLVSLNVESRGSQQTLISWTAVNEQQKGYFVEYSSDAENWKTLGYLESSGNSTGQGKYSFTYSSVVGGRNYYRLKYVGYDGQYSYSEVKFIDVKYNNQVAIGPNPTKGDLQIRSNMNRSTKIFVFDLTGKLIKESILNKGLNTISINHAPPGTYLIRVPGENGELFHEKIIKE